MFVKLALDRAQVSKPRVTPEGYLLIDAIVAGAGVLIYLIGGRPVSVLKPPDEFLTQAFADSLRAAPVTLEHPAQGLVTAASWRRDAHGLVEVAVIDGPYVRATLRITSTDAIDAIRSGAKRDVSVGAEVEWHAEAGEWRGLDGAAQSVSYSMVQRRPRVNHLAVVKDGRYEHAQVFYDSAAWPLSEDTSSKMDQTALLKQVDELRAELAKAQNGAKDEQIAQLKAALDSATAQVSALKADADKLRGEAAGLKTALDSAPKAVDQVRACLDTIAHARKLCPDLALDGLDLSDRAAVQKAALAKRGVNVPEKASPDFIAGAFGTLVPVTIKSPTTRSGTVADAEDPAAKLEAARKARIERDNVRSRGHGVK